MSSYESLAPWYDRLTRDVPYESFCDFYEEEFHKDGGEFRLLLDLGCGTGTMISLMAQRGYEMIGTDASVEMLMQASARCADLPVPPILLHQASQKLDLYGTVDAAYCSLDGMNYIPGEDLPEVFRRLHLFVRPGGLLLFDVRLPDWFHALDGQIFVDEVDEPGRELLCLWRADFDGERQALVYGMDLFQSVGKLWKRTSEEHVEYAHEPEALKAMLETAGFTDVRLRPDCPQGDDGRLFITARRSEA